MKVLCVHGVGHEEAHTADWQPYWTAVIREQLEMDGRPSVDIVFARYDDIFQGYFDRTPFSQIQLAVFTYFPALLATWPSILNNQTDFAWSAGMVGGWLENSDVRKQCRDRIQQTIEAEDPDLIICHSLGGDITYDTLKNNNPALGEGRLLLTGGTQLGNSVVQVALGGLAPINTLQWWWHLYNANDHVFTAALDWTPVAGSGKFTQVDTLFGNYVSGFTDNHSMVPSPGADPQQAYLTNDLTVQQVWPLLRNANPWKLSAALHLVPGSVTWSVPKQFFFGGSSVATQKPKAVFFFESDSQRFSETYYFTPGGSLSDCLQAADTLAESRVQILGSDISLHEIRVSDEAVPRAVEKSYPDYVISGPDFGKADRMFVSILGNGQSSVNNPLPDGMYNDRRYFGGVPDSIAGLPSQAVQQMPTFFPNWLDWTSAVTDGEWGFWPYSRDPGVAPVVDIASIVVGNGFATVTTKLPHLLTAIDQIRVRGSSTPLAPKGIDGAWGPYLSNITATTFEVTTSLPPGTIFTTLGRAHRLVKTFRPYLAMVYDDVVRRKRMADLEGHGKIKHRHKS